MELKAQDLANAVALINRASIQGSEVEEVAALKHRLLAAAQDIRDSEQEQQQERAGGTA